MFWEALGQVAKDDMEESGQGSWDPLSSPGLFIVLAEMSRLQLRGMATGTVVVMNLRSYSLSHYDPKAIPHS